MKYSYEYKRMCVELYRQGKWPETPKGIQKRAFHVMIRKWVRMEDSCGPEALQHKNQNKELTAVSCINGSKDIKKRGIRD